MITIESLGIAGSVIDLGRPGRAWLGQSRGGAVDPVSLALANRLVGNDEHVGGIESSGGLVLRADRPALLAVTGAVAEMDVAGGPPIGWGNPVALPAGARLRIGRVLAGARVYVAVRDGLDGSSPATQPPSTQAAARHEPATTVRLWPGPRRDWFGDDAWQALLDESYVVRDSSRVGVRLTGPPLTRSVTGELPSEGLVEGAVQVPPDGQPIVMLADHPVTGGYPVIAVVDPQDLHHLAQAATGTPLRFRATQVGVHMR